MRHLLLVVLFLMGIASITDRTVKGPVVATQLSSESGDDSDLIDMAQEIEELNETQIRSIYKTEAGDLCDYNLYVQTGKRDWQDRATCLLVEKIGGFYTSAPMEECHSDFAESGRDLFGQATCTRNKFMNKSSNPAVQGAEAAVADFNEGQCANVANWRSQLINTMFSQDVNSPDYARAQNVLMGLNQKEMETCGAGNYWQSQAPTSQTIPFPENGYIPKGTVPAVQ